jgi:DNA-binding GntR family transcriptional regulator
LTDVTGQLLHARVLDDLRAQISSETLKVGDPIPSTAKLRDRYGVSTTVIRRAIEALKAEGILVGQPGKGVYVVATPSEVAAERQTLENLARQVGDLRTEIRRLAEQTGSEDRLKKLTTELAEVRGLVEHLYARLGHPLPNNDWEAARPRRRKSGS